MPNYHPPNLGGQWPEARGFERNFGDAPHQQVRAIEFLLGFIAYHTEFGKADVDAERNAEVVAAAQLVVVDFLEHFPECLLETYVSIDRDVFPREYERNELFYHVLQDRVLGQGDPSL